MARTKRCVKVLDTIWECPDDLWDHVILPIIESLDPPRRTGRKRVDLRQALNGIIYHLRSGCQWNHLPKDFGDDSSVHRTFQRWIQKGVLTEIWSVLVATAKVWAMWITPGRAPTASWARPVLGGSSR